MVFNMDSLAREAANGDKKKPYLKKKGTNYVDTMMLKGLTLTWVGLEVL